MEAPLEAPRVILMSGEKPHIRGNHPQLQLDIIELLREGPMTDVQIRDRLGDLKRGPAHIRVACESLRRVGVVELRDDQWHLR